MTDYYQNLFLASVTLTFATWQFPYIVMYNYLKSLESSVNN